MPIDINQMAREMIAEWLPLHAEFEARVGRKATPEDFIACERPYRTPKHAREIAQASREILLQTNAPPQVVYAYDATGLMPAPSALKHMPEKDRKDYLDAVERYFTLLGAKASSGKH